MAEKKHKDVKEKSKEHHASEKEKSTPKKNDDVVKIRISKNVLFAGIAGIMFIFGVFVGALFFSGASIEKVSLNDASNIAKSTVEYIIAQQSGVAPTITVVDQKDSGSYYTITLDIPGYQPTDVYVSYSGDMVFFQGIPAQTSDSKVDNRVNVSFDETDPVLGDPNAPITIVEFSDFQCPFCRKFALETFAEIKKNYVETGKVKIVYRDFPLQFHPHAFVAAEAAQCANDQGAFWEYHDILFEKQDEWGGLDDIEVIDKFVEYASQLGLDEQQFRDCLESEKYKDEVEQDYQAGIQYGVSGTPTLFINGIKVVGAQPYETVKAIIEQELAKSS